MNIALYLQEKGRQQGLKETYQQAFEEVYQQAFEEAYQQSLDQGCQQGIEQERLRSHQYELDMARTLLQNGVSLEIVMECIGLSYNELISLQ